MRARTVRNIADLYAPAVRFGLAGALLVLVGTISAADAAPITYDLSNASFVETDNGGLTGTITGSFTFDAATGMESNVDLTLSGDVPIFSGTYTEASGGYAGNTNVISAVGTGIWGVTIEFDNALSNTSDPFSTLYFGGSAFASEYIGFPATGSAVPEPVPEPATWAMMLAGLLSLAGVAAVQRRKQPHANSGA